MFTESSNFLNSRPRPRRRIAPDVVERRRQPIAGHFARRQRPSTRRRREPDGVFAFEDHVRSVGDKRLVHAARPGAIADVEVRAELRRREQGLAADVVVAHRDRRGRKQHREREHGDGPQAARHRPIAVPDEQPRRQKRKQQPRVLAVEHETAKHGAERDQPPRPPIGDIRGDGTRQRRHQDEIDRRLLDVTVEEDRRRIERERGAGDQPDPPVEEPSSRDGHEHAGERAGERLQDPDEIDGHAERLERDGQQIGIERRLVEHLRPDPVAGCDLGRPLDVALRVSDEDGEHRSPRQRARVDQADGAREHREAGEQQGPARGRRPDR